MKRIGYCLLYPTLLLLGLGFARAGETPPAGHIVLPSIFSENMVLQRDVPIPVWGWAPEGDEITVQFAGQKVNTVAKDGKWQVMLAPCKAGGPFTFAVFGKDINDTVMFTQEMVGEVWLACGQSNMMMGVTDAAEAADAIAVRFNYPNIHIAQMGMRGTESVETPQTQTAGFWGPVKWENSTYTIPRSNKTDIPGCTSAVSYYFAREMYKYFKGNVPVGMIECTALLPAIAWVDDQTLADTPALAALRGKPYPIASSRGYLANIAPLAPFPIRGVIYYQGEMDSGNGIQYRAALPALIRSWRTTWHNPTMPFLFVQLAGFTDNTAPPNARLDMDPAILAQFHRQSAEHGYCGVREAQAMTAESVPFAGMASAVNLGDPYNIHPKQKRQVGERLFLLARKFAYGEKDLTACGPAPEQIVNKGDHFEVTFKYIGGGLVAKHAALRGFELSENGKDFVAAQARIVGNTVIVSSPEVKAPTALSYAWAGYPLCDLYNKEGLPATPFRYPVP